VTLIEGQQNSINSLFN